jgi:hypothetical protein
MSRPHLLPPVAISSESLSESLNLTGSRPGSRLSVASSKRMSYIQELRSKRDVSDTASMMTVDEITAEVESRRESAGSDSDEWTAVEAGDVDAQSIKEIPEEEEEEREEEEEFEEEEEAEVTEGTLTDEEGEPGKAITSQGGKFNLLHKTLKRSLMSTCRKNYQVDQGCPHWSWLLWQSIPGHGRRHRFAHGCQASRAALWLYSKR